MEEGRARGENMAGTLIREFCAENVEHVPAAISAGASRVELCDNLAVGGTTPSHGVIHAAVELCHPVGVSVMCMIRPRGGSFEYSPAEARIMTHDLKAAAAAGVDGVVFGCLRGGHLDRLLSMSLARMAKGLGLQVTFHMAFDQLSREEALGAIDYLSRFGVDRILTHGGPEGTPIEENLANLKRYVDHAAGRIAILPGGGITWENAEAVAQALGVGEVHGTKIVPIG